MSAIKVARSKRSVLFTNYGNTFHELDGIIIDSRTRFLPNSTTTELGRKDTGTWGGGGKFIALIHKDRAEKR